MGAEGQTMKILRVRGWDRHYENNRTREMKRMVWIPVTTRLDSDGYTELMGMKNGPAYFGCWIAILEVASQCSPRGLLRRSDGSAHDAASLGRLVRIDHRTMRAACAALIRIKWLEEADVPAPTPHPSRTLPAAKLPSLEGRKEGRIQRDETKAPEASAGLVPAGPPDAGTEPPERKQSPRIPGRRGPLPPEAQADLDRMRALREPGGLDPGKPRTVACSPVYATFGTRAPPPGHRVGHLLREPDDA